MGERTFLSPYLHPISSVLNGRLHKSPHQCRVRIGLYTLSSRWGLCMGCHIMKGVSERCIVRLLLTIGEKKGVSPIHIILNSLLSTHCDVLLPFFGQFKEFIPCSIVKTKGSNHFHCSTPVYIHSVPHNSNSLTHCLFQRPPSTPKLTTLTQC